MKELFFENWKAKLASLLIAMSIWYVIKSNLDKSMKTSIELMLSDIIIKYNDLLKNVENINKEKAE